MTQDLTNEEQMRESLAEKNMLQPIDDIASRKKTMKNAVRTTQQKKHIHLSVSSVTLQKIKAKAYQEGIPYQTLINSVLHKYVSL